MVFYNPCITLKNMQITCLVFLRINMNCLNTFLVQSTCVTPRLPPTWTVRPLVAPKTVDSLSLFGPMGMLQPHHTNKGPTCKPKPNMRPPRRACKHRDSQPSLTYHCAPTKEKPIFKLKLHSGNHKYI